MALLKLLYYGHPLLRKRSEPVQEITDEIRQLVRDMIETMDQFSGCGLAACQIGRSIRLFVLRDYIFGEEGTWTLAEPKVYINPKLSNPGEYRISDSEGCLSIPGLRLPVARPDKITVEAMDLEGKIFIEEAEGYNARIRMHENDHINGVLFIDRLEPTLRNEIEPFLKEIKQTHPQE